jgi:hypothetical protein
MHLFIFYLLVSGMLINFRFAALRAHFYIIVGANVLPQRQLRSCGL